MRSSKHGTPPPLRPCTNCGLTIPMGRYGDYFDRPSASKSTVVCSIACGNELAHRLARAVPDVVKLLPPKETSVWRNHKSRCTDDVAPTEQWHDNGFAYQGARSKP